jgi:hypothetical protein
MHELTRFVKGTLQLVTGGFSDMLKSMDQSENMEVKDAHLAWSILDYFDKEIAKRKKLLRKRLLGAVADRGDVQDNGNVVLNVGGGGVVTRQRRVSKSVDNSGICDLARQESIPITGVGEWKFVADEHKLMDLIAEGVLTVEQVAEHVTEKETFALSVRKPRGLRKLLGV